jgi:hypothetical protein
MVLPAQPITVVPQPNLEPSTERIELPDVRSASGKRHHITTLWLAVFTLVMTAGNQGFQAICDWLKCYRSELIELFNLPKHKISSYSAIRHILINLNYRQYSAALKLVSKVNLKSAQSFTPQGFACLSGLGS